MSIRTSHITKRFGNVTVLDDVSVEVPSGALVALLGPSGSGKTTLLRIIAGLEVPDAGSVSYAQTDVTGHAPKDRNVGFVFQHYALFRHMTVFENVAFALRVRNWPAQKVRDRVRELLHLVRLDGLERRHPGELSGGQKQRVALIRALAAEPKVLLLDEPFAALDAKVRQELRTELLRLHEETHITSLFVTHDQEEAFEVADRVVVMNHGKVEQAGTPGEVFDHPANAFVMDFLGHVNVFHARMLSGRSQLGGVPAGDHPHDARIYVRPHELSIEREASEAGHSLLARVVHINPAGSVVKVRLLADEFDLAVNVDLSPADSASLKLKVGESVYVVPQKLRVFSHAEPDYAI